MKIYDCFSYLDEDLLLDLRLNILDKFVDYFVIVESDKTWQNNHKNHNFDISKFKEFEEKIIYIKVTDMPDGDNPYLRENYQRNCISRGIEKADNEDLIHKKLEILKGDKLFYTLAQEMKSFITSSEPDADFISEEY